MVQITPTDPQLLVNWPSCQRFFFVKGFIRRRLQPIVSAGESTIPSLVSQTTTIIF